jgi:plastocyanin
MNLTQLRYVGAICFVLVLVLAFEVSGWQKQKAKKSVALDCGNQTLTIDPTDGTVPKAIYVCVGDVITWDANGHQFTVKFKKKSPFGNVKDFDNSHNVSPPAKPDIHLTVYEYEVTIDGKPVDDPQVIGGGGHED